MQGAAVCADSLAEVCDREPLLAALVQEACSPAGGLVTVHRSGGLAVVFELSEQGIEDGVFERMRNRWPREFPGILQRRPKRRGKSPPDSLRSPGPGKPQDPCPVMHGKRLIPQASRPPVEFLPAYGNGHNINLAHERKIESAGIFLDDHFSGFHQAAAELHPRIGVQRKCQNHCPRRNGSANPRAQRPPGSSKLERRRMNCTRGKPVGAFLELSGLHVPFDGHGGRLLEAFRLRIDDRSRRKERR